MVFVSPKPKFKDIKMCFICGSRTRAKKIAERGKNELLSSKKIYKLNISPWFDFYKVESLLVISHGMGSGSVESLLDDLLPLLSSKTQVIRIGSSGGVNVNGGTQVITIETLNEFTRPFYEFYNCGKKQRLYSIINSDFVSKLYQSNKDLNLVKGKTIAAKTYYEGQARLDGSSCTYTEEDKMSWLHTLHDLGVRNFEMEGIMCSSMCNQYRIPFSMVCASYLDRLKGDASPANATSENFSRWADESITVALKYTSKFIFK